MADTEPVSSKLALTGSRTVLPVDEATRLAAGILLCAGFGSQIACEVARHLVDADMCGVESHGIVRVLQYVEQCASGYLQSGAVAKLCRDESGIEWVDGGGGIGIPAMRLAVEQVSSAARRSGVAVLPVRNVGHTGRLGAFAETAAENDCLIMIVGGGGRQQWRQVAPYGGRTALLPTNPYCLGIPGGEQGPVVIDFATSVIAGGWLHSARAAGAQVPAGAVIDAQGHPSRDPAAYFAGGAILPKGGPMGYGMAVMAEMICEAMLGPVTTECNWLTLAIDTRRYREAGAMRRAAEEVLAELRACPPAPGFERVEVPGERERNARARSLVAGIAVPDQTLGKIRALASRLDDAQSAGGV